MLEPWRKAFAKLPMGGVASLAWPLIVANVSQTLLGIVDTAILGHLDDPSHLAGVAVGTAIFSFLFWGFGFLRMGTTGMTAQLSGAAEVRLTGATGDPALKVLLLRAAALAVVIGLIAITVRGPLFGYAIRLLGSGAGSAATDAAGLYSSIRIFGAPIVLVNFVATGWLMGLGAPKAVLSTMVAINLANVLLDLLFVLGFGMTVDGVAWGSVLAETIGALVALHFIRRHWHRMPGQVALAALTDWPSYRQLIAINRDLFLRTLALLCVFAFFTAEGASQGAIVLAANAILLNFFTLAAHGLDGFAQATEVLTGRALGRRHLRGFHQATAAAAVWCTLTAGVYAALLAVLGRAAIQGFTDIAPVAATAVEYLAWMVAIPLLAAGCFLMDGVFIGATRATAMRDTMIVSTFGVAVPVWWLALPALGNHGLWLGFASFFAARTLTMGFMYGYFSRGGRWLLNVDVAATSDR